MPRFTDDELRRLADEHQVPDRDIKVRDAWMRRAVRQAQTAKEREVIRRFAETPAYDDAAAQRALLPVYTDLPGVGRWPRATHVWRSRSLAVRAPGSEAWVVTLQGDPAAADVEDFRTLGPFTSWAEAMEVARDEARYIVQRPARPAPATTDRVAELRAAAFTDPTDVQEVCS